MRSQLFKFLFLCLLAFNVACTNSGGENSSAETTEAEPEAEVVATEETPVAETMGNESYQITVLKPDLPSPRKEMKGTIGDLEVTVNYGSPSMKGRELWGALIPYGEVWRTGANEATTFEVTQDVMIEGQKLPAGKYALATIPGEESWEIIFNSQAEQWGAYEMDESKNVLKVSVSPKTSSTASETLDFKVEGDEVIMMWDKLAVPFNVSAS
ncbi:MAG: hypothetical protein DHS20C18_38350 [Saprospiraceae bacterium]|nr:MAG: hypothetical protein DHS20C18_38350 [Saprospiraceae bacterium]